LSIPIVTSCIPERHLLVGAAAQRSGRGIQPRNMHALQVGRPGGGRVVGKRFHHHHRPSKQGDVARALVFAMDASRGRMNSARCRVSRQAWPWRIGGGPPAGYLRSALAAELSSRGVIETTTYSRSLLSMSSTRRIILSFSMRNWACSPTGKSTGCFSSRGRIR
jgi:hypothetical protein